MDPTMRLVEDARRSLALPVAILLAASVCACGSSKPSTDSHVSPSTAAADESPSETARLLRTDADKDNDFEAADDDTNNNSVLEYGHPASASDRRAIVSLLKRYYKVALAQEGAKACSLLYSMLAEGVPEDYGSYAGPVYMRGNSCPTIMTKLFTHFHPVLALELPKFKVRWIGLEEHYGRAVLSFGRLPEREIRLAREGHTWKVDTLLDGELS